MSIQPRETKKAPVVGPMSWIAMGNMKELLERERGSQMTRLKF